VTPWPTLRDRLPWRRRRDLVSLAGRFGTDKWGRHWYARHYERHLAPFRERAITLLEIGVGGYDDPRAGGESLRMWKAFFPRARVFGLDVYDKSALQEDRIRIVQGSQDDPAVIERLVAETGPLDVVIDDGSHYVPHVLRTFELVFPHLREGGIYAAEDLQTSYWPKYGGSLDPDAGNTSMAAFKRLADGLNHAERIGYRPTPLDRSVRAVHFYHNLVFVERGANDEGSNVLRDNVAPDWIVE
jgi:hypothetical protein